jgi:hypothetical protein
MVEVEGETTLIAVGQRLTATVADLQPREQTAGATAIVSTSRPPSEPPAEKMRRFSQQQPVQEGDPVQQPPKKKQRLGLGSGNHSPGSQYKSICIFDDDDDNDDGDDNDDDDFLPVTPSCKEQSPAREAASGSQEQQQQRQQQQQSAWHLAYDEYCCEYFDADRSFFLQELILASLQRVDFWQTDVQRSLAKCVADQYTAVGDTEYAWLRSKLTPQGWVLFDKELRKSRGIVRCTLIAFCRLLGCLGFFYLQLM